MDTHNITTHCMDSVKIIKEMDKIYTFMKTSIISDRSNVILGPVYDNDKENWRILTNKEMCVR
jgi:hypothetical protein